ncbi:PREDICTED: F-box/LRR-repeat protein At3g48880-like [Populus euphratica]|uniref:F-box/LRR-repeat protein At3g48880-like n=1 Tax=Populus euphratica TaxID=75702 RepID=A0AAJ6U3Q2_POPEU|nr:PREDICTED: F-box/LRR-repeat protein At3g48880-like [Populus euphratica]
MESKIYIRAVRRTWETLDYAILVKIFMKLSILDLVSNACRVCTSWSRACSDSILWGTHDVGALKFGLMKVIQRRSCRAFEQCNRMLLPMLNIALTLSCNNVTRLIFDFNMNIKDEQLIFAAERCSNLKQLVLPAWNQIRADMLCAAIGKLKGLESPYDHDFATTLFIYIPNLKVLSLRYCSVLHKDALKITLMLFDFEVLNISHSVIVDTHQTKNPFRYTGSVTR